MADTKYLINESTLTDIANKIREKTGESNLISVSDFADKIDEINNFVIQESKTVTQNGTVTPDSGYDALAEVIVNVSGGSGGGAFSSGSVTIMSGTTDPVTIEHGLGVEPNCIFVFSNARIAGNVEYFKGGWKFDDLCGYASANAVTVVTAYNNEFRGGALNNSCVINIDEDYFDITPQSYPFVPDGCTIYWFAIYVDTAS